MAQTAVPTCPSKEDTWCLYCCLLCAFQFLAEIKHPRKVKASHVSRTRAVVVAGGLPLCVVVGAGLSAPALKAGPSETAVVRKEGQRERERKRERERERGGQTPAGIYSWQHKRLEIVNGAGGNR